MGDQLALFIDFENVAIWAEEHFFDLELDRLMEYLQRRGAVVVKRAYGDWGRFDRYRDDLLDNSIDLIQMYSIRPGKNRADIRLALDAFETATTRPQIGTIVVVSGDSDFGALASKLREYGRHVLGIGPSEITHPLLVKACDEFVYMETILGPEPEAAVPMPTSLAASYESIFTKVIAADLETRRDVLRDIYRELSERPGEWAPGALRDELELRYESKGLVRSRKLLYRIWQLGFHQRAYEHLDNAPLSTTVRLAADINSQAAFIVRAESGFVYAVVESGLQIDRAELASVLLNDPTQVEYIQELLDDLERRKCIARVNGRYRLPGRSANPLLDDPHLQVVVRDLKAAQLPEGLDRDVEAARVLARSGMAKRTNDFAASAQDYLVACRLLWDAVERQDPKATLEELRWYVASYASVKAGELSQVHRKYAAAQPYYLAFFSLLQEGTPLWDRMRRLINPMLHFYWRNIARQMGIALQSTASPVDAAVLMATHTELREKWQEATRQLAQISPDVLRRVAGQVRLVQGGSPQNAQVAEQIEQMLTD